MSDILDQAEIDALMKGVSTGAVDTEPKPADEAGVARDYDFVTQSRIVRDRMPTLEMVNERMARGLRASLYPLVRRTPEITVEGVTTRKYSDYIHSLAVPTSLNLIRFQPLSGTGLVVFEAKLIFALIDVFFGGTGRHAKIEGRDFTATEHEMIQLLLQQAFAAAQEAWSAVLPARIEFVNSEMNPAFASIVSPTDIVVVSRLRIEFEGRGGEVHLTLPYAMLEPLRDTLRAGLHSGAEREERWSHLLRNELEETEVDIVTQLGTASTTVARLIDMRPGDVIPIEFDGQATVLADGIPIFWGELGQQRGRQVVRVRQMNARKVRNSLDAFARKSA